MCVCGTNPVYKASENKKMALAKKIGGLSNQLLFKNKVFLYNSIRCYSDKPLPWNYLWQPDKYSEKDHDKIAKKFNMHPKEYKPFSDKEACVGDYPDISKIGPAAKDPYYPYDMPVYRKNYHEMLHPDFEMMGEDRFSFGYKYRIDLALASAIFVAFVCTLGLITYITDPYPSFIPVMEKQYPHKGEAHYSFEPTK
ncbi:NADH dehydrogenase [ubiquinone] 1 beta subcomplex subunit 8, mitochondrial [Linepithema humile]|uniref:NADH dehydrogenase [ubiquinone] 1 beta subcomplex subunit 8, mitochondrial n=1 Tax=Linepithema humile TaxID=83485 RepID=UPI0006237C87|nr:PREDICTED: NADH dehydrogenase [ubiquinone] 1 beta subcomplex subunit 8, mitochondrial [Linepithema humile]